MKTYTGLEKRKYPRQNEKVPFLYRAAESTSLDYLSKAKSCATEDISEGGFCFETDIYIPPNSMLEVQINKAVDSANAKVIWVKRVNSGKYRLGLQFVDN